MAKLEITLRKRNNSKEDLIADLRRVADEVGGDKSVTAIVYTDRGKFGVNTMLRRFGSWNAALAQAGLPINNVLNVPDDELHQNLADVWQKIGRQPVGNDVDKGSGISKFSLGTYEKRFGTWNKALQAFADFINADESYRPELAKRAAGRNRARTSRNINWRMRATVLIRDSCICRMCGASPSKDSAVTLHVDHIEPWSKGGETTLNNLQTLCSVCNIGKSDQILS
jgi:Homing endonuclease associated repeat/HNH endonuclease